MIAPLDDSGLYGPVGRRLLRLGAWLFIAFLVSLVYAGLTTATNLREPVVVSRLQAGLLAIVAAFLIGFLLGQVAAAKRGDA